MKLLITVVLCLAAYGFSQPAPSEVAPTAPVLKVASAVISSSDTHRGESRAAFRFENDARRSGGVNLRRNGDLTFSGKSGTLTCRKHTADQSTIIDLGEKSWDQIDALPAQRASDSYAAPALAGHAYLIHINDTESDYWTVIRIAAIVENEQCKIEWIRIDQTEPSPRPEISPSAQSRLARLLNGQDANTDPSLVLQAPKVVLQIRAGATGGNPSRIDMLGRKTAYVDHISPNLLSFDAPPDIHERSVAYFNGGQVPLGKCFVIKKITFRGAASGDSNGHGEFIVHAGRTDVAKERDIAIVPGGKWEGHIEVRRGEESSVYLEVANSSMGDVLIEGEFVDDKAPAQADNGLDNALLKQEPKIILQVRSGADGGNPNRIDMLGRKSIYIDRISAAPLSFDNAPDMRERSVAYYKGCSVPPGKVLVIKTVNYAGSAKGDSNGHGAIIVHVGKTDIVNQRDTTTVPAAQWQGNIEIRRGEESSVYVEVANSSMADVLIQGEFADDHKAPKRQP